MKKMNDPKTIVDNLKQYVKEYGRLTFIALAFLVGVYLGDYLTFNINSVIIVISFLIGCLIVMLFIIDILKGNEKDE